MAIIEKLPLPAEEIRAITSRIRPWAEVDIGKPVFMANLIHFFPEVRTFPGAPEFKGIPEETNAHYEKGRTGSRSHTPSARTPRASQSARAGR